MKTLSIYNRLSKQGGSVSYADAIGNHVAELMNCSVRGARLPVSDVSPAAHSVVNFGCPPLATASGLRFDPQRIAAHMQEVMQRFEPRVEVEMTSVSASNAKGQAADPHIVYFEIRTVVRENGEPVRLCLEFNCLSGYFSLCGD